MFIARRSNNHPSSSGAKCGHALMPLLRSWEISSYGFYTHCAPPERGGGILTPERGGGILTLIVIVSRA
jgi:hypothetical protein